MPWCLQRSANLLLSAGLIAARALHPARNSARTASRRRPLSQPPALTVSAPATEPQQPALPPLGSDADPRIGRYGQQQLDLLLLTVEAIDLNGNEAMLYALQKQGYSEAIPNRVEFWKHRNTNPLRQTNRRGGLSRDETTALICLVCHMAERLFPVLRQLVSPKGDLAVADRRWQQTSERLQALVQQRMNPKRASVQQFADADHALAVTRRMVRALTFCAGPGGPQRLLASLQDGMRP